MTKVIQEGQTSISYVFRQSVVKSEVVFQAQNLTNIANTALSNGLLQFRKTCGNRYVSKVKKGAYVYVALTYKFAKKEDKDSFKSSVKASGTAKLVDFGVSGSASQQITSKKFKGTLSVQAVQAGGLPERIGSILGSSGAAANVASCSYDNMSPCFSLEDNLRNYVNNDFPAQISNNSNLANVDYVLADYVGFVSGQLPSVVSPTVQGYRDWTSIFIDYWTAERAYAEGLLALDSTINYSPKLQALNSLVADLNFNIAAYAEVNKTCWEYPLDQCTQTYVNSKVLRSINEDVLANSHELRSFTDASGKITTKIFYRKSGTSSDIFTDYPVDVPAGYVVVGGGALGSAEIGNLIFGSYPSNDLKSWIVSTEAHMVSHPAPIQGYAIGMKIQGLTDAQLKSYISLTSATSASSSLPTSNVNIPSGYLLIGGGIKVDLGGAPGTMGNMATGSIYNFLGVGWIVASKAHLKESPSPVTAYAIGIKSSIPNVGTLTNFGSVVQSGTAHSPSQTTSFADNTYALTSCGANATYTGLGILLWELRPNASSTVPSCVASAKSHSEYDYSGKIATATVGLRVN